jgi:hypothetical protein
VCFFTCKKKKGVTPLHFTTLLTNTGVYVDANTIIWCASLLGAIGVLIGFAYRFFSWVEEQKAQSKKIQEIQGEQTVICYVLLAALDGLTQLGANGEVSKAHDMLSKHINKKAHDQT